ncbi:MAG: hypothetical protein JEZ00_12495 [Anaerolineaceae bacterium]|nr:hypothetical protein [Anaerolineaceae bacterium]
MSYEEKNITVSLSSSIFILGYFVVKWLQMFQGEGLIASRIYSLWATVIIATIVVNIAGSILTNIVMSIVHAIKTQSEDPEQFITDERDKLISLKGSKISYIVFSIGVLISMLTFVVGQPPLIMFSLIIFFSIFSEIIGSLTQVVIYRRGF